MKKSMLIASLAIISMNVLGMNQLNNNNHIGNQSRHTLTPASSPRNNSNLIESIQESFSKFSQGNLSENETQDLVNTMFSFIISPETTQARNSISELEQKIINLERQRNAQLISEKNSEISRLDEQNQILQLRIEDLILNTRSQNNRISEVNNHIAQYQLEQPLVLRSSAKRHAPEDNSVSQPSAQRRRIDIEDLILNTRSQNNRISELNNHIAQYQLEQPLVLRSSAKRLAPEDNSVSQPSAQRRRIDLEEASSSTSHLQQPVEVQEEIAVNRQNDVEQIDQNLVNKITLNNWGRSALNPRECIKLFSYLTDPNYAGGILNKYLSFAATALNMWTAITDNEREYLSILARNILNSPENFPIQDKQRMSDLKTAITQNDNLEIMANTGHLKQDLIKFINSIRGRKSNKNTYSYKNLIPLFVTVLAQTNWPVQPFVATDAELNNFEQSVQTFMNQYDQKKSELEKSNNPDKDKLLKINIVDTLRNLRRFGIKDNVIVNKLNLFDLKYNDKSLAYQELKALYPCLQKGFYFNTARSKAIKSLNKQDISNRKIKELLGISRNCLRSHLNTLDSTSHLQQPVEIQDEITANRQNDQNLVNKITINN